MALIPLPSECMIMHEINPNSHALLYYFALPSYEACNGRAARAPLVEYPFWRIVLG